MALTRRWGRRQDRGVGVRLLWLPLGAGGAACVRLNGRLYQAVTGRRLYHSALLVTVGATGYAIEMAPVWGVREAGRGVVAEGPVGSVWLGRSALFRYEVRCWRDGFIPDATAAAGGPVVLEEDGHGADGDETGARIVALAPAFPAATWGRDELDVGEMWNSNSLISWLLTGAGYPADRLRPPGRGTAPGWAAGIRAARRYGCGARPVPGR